jgi:signal transduction histidine kinase
VRERAALLGGDLKIESVPGKGTIVELRLHIHEEVAA